MNPPLPNPSSFTFLPSTPTPNFFYPRLQDPPPQSLDLPTTLSTLKDLISLSETTIDSFSTLLRPATATAAATATANCSSSSGFCPCPFNPHHRVPPESLFRHSLQCPSSPAILDLTLIESLHYPNTLQSSEELVKQSRFVRTLHDSDAELCFSLDDYGDFGSNFFYRDCPAVVSLNDQDNSKRTFTLPGILSAECANFIGGGDCEIKGFSRVCLRVLPSELWFLRSEIEAWNDFPTTYSYRVLRAILCLLMTKECDFLKWVIVNSPRYGIVIDVPMRDHMVLLFRLCLKAITREAVGSADLVFNRKVNELNLTTLSFKCPVLVEVLKWLSFHLSVLYGEGNGKFFAMNMLKQCLLNASLKSSLFPSVQKASESSAFKEAEVDGKLEELLERSMENEGNVKEGETINSRVIFVSQVAAAIAALHERSLLEEKIKAFRDAQSLANYQRIAEYAYLSKRADEERLKRSNYRPIIEHDGLLWQRSCNQETNKMKTREELLAEERDYKRRRMSYRGKKLKRTTTQVMRDIIEEYTEEIKQAGGIGCLLKGAEEAGTSAPFPAGDVSSGYELKRPVSNSHGVGKGWPHSYRKQLNSQDDIGLKKFEDEYSEAHKQKHHRRDFERHYGHNKAERSVSRDRRHGAGNTDGYRRRQDSLRHHEHLEAERSISRDRCGEYYSRSPDTRRSDGRLHEYISNQRQQDNVDVSGKYLHRSPDRNHSKSHEQTSHQRERVDQNLDVKTRQQRSTYRNYRSESVIHHDFEDRYDPSESHDMYEDDVSSGSKYIRPE
ncbi:hypothetical protein F0562_025637 [Nyssa sinensis]|uniref:CHHC U11-48K-type domain-containing protein n=1 Tax=Nyssa sinensis TaxID=561372 RepID=A0A5J5B6V2_9ASTE|nr:hypothetical protein F0562_025637 [Nyssa sinensis]